MSRYLPYLLIFLLGGGIGFFIGNSSAISTHEKKNSIPVSDPEAKPSDSPIIKVNRKDPSEDNLPVEPVITEKPTSPIPVTIDCISEDKDMSMILNLFSEKLEKDSIWYSSKRPEELRDCSGIFFRVMNEIKTTCGNYQYPDPKKDRSSRMIARWYHDKGNLSLVHDPMKSRELIEPGAVLFFGKSNAKYNKITMDLLSNKKGVGEISHMGVVTEVKKDEEGKVIGYVMMHGHRPGKIAHRTHYHGVEPPRLNYPVLGNWNQQLVAIANIMTPDVAKKDKPVLALEKPVEPRLEMESVAKSRDKKEKEAEVVAVLNPTLDCFNTTDVLSEALTQHAIKLEKQNIMYSQVPPEDLRDCSGIFFRMTNFVKENCQSYVYPNPKEARSTKTLARWYYNRGNLLIVNNAAKSLDAIKPGAVMFFGQWNKKYTSLNIDVITSSKGIQHMGVVTEIVRNDAGEAIGYKMMHGRSSGKVAKRTLHLKNPPPGTSGLGHWKQQLVAVANIMTPKPGSV